MHWRRLRIWICGLVWAALLASFHPLSVSAEQSVAPPTTLIGKLQSLARRAAVIFAGQVVSIERRGGLVEITFRVEQPVHGAVGASYTLHEWAGLWPQGQLRYQVGQRALIFIHGASAAGLASPVDGPEGVVPLVVQGANAPVLLDVRRLSASLKRAPGTPLPSEGQSAIALGDAVRLIAQTGYTLPQEPVRVPLPVRGTVIPKIPLSPGPLPGAGKGALGGSPAAGLRSELRPVEESNAPR